MRPGTVRLRLLHDNDPPAHDTGEPYVFGLQTTKQEILPGRTLPGGGLVFDFELKVKPGTDAEHPVFGGPLACGPVDDRFVYLSWKAVLRGGYINRIKARLSSITWDQVRQAQKPGRVLEADMKGRTPHDTRSLVWTVV